MLFSIYLTYFTIYSYILRLLTFMGGSLNSEFRNYNVGVCIISSKALYACVTYVRGRWSEIWGNPIER